MYKPIHAFRLALVTFACLAALGAYAQSAVGSWSGHVDFSGAKGKDAKEQKSIDQMKQMFGSATIKLTMSANKTYHIVFPPVGGMKGQTEDGKWTQKGNAVTFIDPKAHKETATLSSDGRTMVLLPPKEDPGPKGIKVVLKRS